MLTQSDLPLCHSVNLSLCCLLKVSTVLPYCRHTFSTDCYNVNILLPCCYYTGTPLFTRLKDGVVIWHFIFAVKLLKLLSFFLVGVSDECFFNEVNVYSLSQVELGRIKDCLTRLFFDPHNKVKHTTVYKFVCWKSRISCSRYTGNTHIQMARVSVDFNLTNVTPRFLPWLDKLIW